MKKYVLCGLMLFILGLTLACNPGENKPAAVPQPCGTDIPTSYCTTYDSQRYPDNPYSPYSGYGQGYGHHQPGYPNGAYGCPYGYQPLYTGGTWGGTQYTCVQVGYLQGSGHTPYYPRHWQWSNSNYGWGPLQACDSYVGTSCASGSVCQATFGSRFGYCVVR